MASKALHAIVSYGIFGYGLVNMARTSHAPKGSRYTQQLDATVDPGPDGCFARSAVLSTTELLEQILSYLSFQDILAVCGVAKTWHQTVLSSPSLRTATFLHSTATPLVLFKTGAVANHDDTAWSKRSFFPRLSIDNNIRPQKDLVLNPIFVQDAASSSSGCRSPYFYTLVVDSATSERLLTFHAPLGGFAARSVDIGIAANMHLAHPPLTAVNGYICGASYRETTFTIRDETGVKLGQVQDFVRRMLEQIKGTGMWGSDVAMLLLDGVTFVCRIEA